jgi:hypothetical protein
VDYAALIHPTFGVFLIKEHYKEKEYLFRVINWLLLKRAKIFQNTIIKVNVRRLKMPYKIGKKTKTRGWTILKQEQGRWKVIAHSDSKAKAAASIRARHAGKHNPNWK